jgi:CBS domain-containing protein
MSKIILVRDVMATKLYTLQPEMSLIQAIGLLLKHKISGAPVVSEDGQLVGVISEKDCLRLFANEAFYDQATEARVADYMSSAVETIEADADVFKAAQIFLKNTFRRLPVLDEGNLVGQVSRRDILMASLKLVHESPMKKAWTDAKYIPEELLAVINSKSFSGKD